MRGLSRQRKVFGRWRTTVSGKGFKFELTPSGLRIREKYARRAVLLSFTDAVDAAYGQRRLL